MRSTLRFWEKYCSFPTATVKQAVLWRKLRICLHIYTHPRTARPTMAESMTTQPSIDLIAERVERLLVRHEELQRTNTLLTDQVTALTQERDLLRLRLQAARARVDALIERLPANQGE